MKRYLAMQRYRTRPLMFLEYRPEKHVASLPPWRPGQTESRSRCTIAKSTPAADQSSTAGSRRWNTPAGKVNLIATAEAEACPKATTDGRNPAEIPRRCRQNRAESPRSARRHRELHQAASEPITTATPLRIKRRLASFH